MLKVIFFFFIRFTYITFAVANSGWKKIW